MKLSEMPVDMGLDVMLEILPSMQEILSDPAFSATLTEEEKSGKVVDIAAKVVPLMAGPHREAMKHIARTVSGKGDEMTLDDFVDAFSSAFGGPVLRFFTFSAALAARK